MNRHPYGGGQPRRRLFPLTLLLTVVALCASLIGLPQQEAAAGTTAAAALPTGWTTISNKGNGKCVDARAAATGNGTAVQQYACNGSLAQNWSLTETGAGYVRAGNRNADSQVWDVTDVSAADAATIQLWTYGGGNNQQWLPVAEADGAYHFVNRNSGKCLDVPSASTADSVQLQQYTCNGSAAQSFRVQAADPPAPPAPRISGRTSSSSIRRCRPPRSRTG